MSAASSAATQTADPVRRRLQSNFTLSLSEKQIIETLHEGRMRHRAGAELILEGARAATPMFLTRGWAACERRLPDGRRQILRLLTPGDIVGLEGGRGPPAWTVVALTDVTVVSARPVIDAASSGQAPGLARAITLAVRQEERQFLDHIVRLGRMSASERAANLLLELRDRLRAAGLGDETQFPLPLTQEMLADTLGLSAVHVNRVIKEMRRVGALVLRAGLVVLPDTQAIERLALRGAPATSSLAEAVPKVAPNRDGPVAAATAVGASRACRS